MLTNEKVEKYFQVTRKALDKVKIGKERELDWKKTAEDFLDMATRYFDDASYFYKKDDLVNAFAALNYAHGWLDAGSRIGLFDVGFDSTLFTVDKDMFNE
ncbi:MAG: DUF357 domain-containing protein [Candidatus Woesearchaeota archaeon]